MKRKTKHVVHYLPFLEIKKPVRLGVVQFFPYPEHADMIGNSELVPYIEKIKNSFWIEKGRPLESITLAKYLPKPWSQLNDDEQKTMLHTNVILCFCCLAANEPSTEKPYRNSSNFKINTQHLSLNSDFFSIETRRRWGTELTGGFKWGRYVQVIPDYIGRIGETRFDEQLLTIFNNILKVKLGTYPELDISLEWFYWANTDSSYTNLDLEAVLMASAFEALFKIPLGVNKRKFLMEAIRCHFSNYERIIVTKPDTLGTKLKTRGWKEFWFDEFYWYRNCISHGVKPNWRGKIWNPLEHLFIAYKIFIDSIRVKFEKERHLKLDIEAMARIDATDEIIRNGKIFKKNWNKIFSSQLWKTISYQIKKKLPTMKTKRKKRESE
jgi:hypothetical protein